MPLATKHYDDYEVFWVLSATKKKRGHSFSDRNRFRLLPLYFKYLILGYHTQLYTSWLSSND